MLYIKERRGYLLPSTSANGKRTCNKVCLIAQPNFQFSTFNFQLNQSLAF